jgi:hypothetical protein
VPRPRQIPPEDALLSAAEASGLVKVSRSRWDAYVKRFPTLLRGRRLVRVNPDGKGVMRYLKSAVIEHIHVDLPQDRVEAAL